MPSPRVILILTSGPLCRNPRVLKEAATLGGAGYEVTVMTVAASARFEAYDDEILKTAAFRKVAFNQIARGGIAGARSFASRLGTWLARHGARAGLQFPQALGPSRALGRMARRFKADLTIVHTEMPFCIGCSLLSEGRRVAADFEDWHSRDLLPSTQTTRPIRLIRRVERELMQRASYTSTTSLVLAHALRATLGGALPVVITNSFPLQEEPPARPASAPPSFIWFSQTIGPGRGLELFIAAWRQTSPASRLCLLGDVDAAYRSKLLGLLPPDRRGLLEFLPLTSPKNLPAAIARHDIGLALELDFPTSKDCTISNKILQYLNAGLAVVASNTAGQREVFSQAPGAGILITLSQTTALVAQLDELLSDRARIASLGRAARRAAVETYSWQRQAPLLLAAVESALRPTG
jgi:glycosyltransferase involved in cell wall biosynthesis